MKAYLASVLEDLVGEYVLNISKENLKLAALRGQIKLENVELDGDVIGSYVLGAVGLSGFGVLSCWARTLKISIPWTNLDAPTSLEIHGMHLVCVPLLPTTANRTYFGGQTLQTKAKRSALARFERNYISGRIQGEGPQEMSRFIGRRRRLYSNEDLADVDDDGDGIETHMHESFQDDSEREANLPNKSDRKSGLAALKRKVTSKVYENLVSSINDVHIRCEVPAGGLSMNSSSNNMESNTLDATDDGRAFAFGFTLKCVSMRNMPEASVLSDNGDIMSRFDQSHTAALHSPDDGKKTFKKAEIEDLAIYWDQDPCYLISDSALLQGQVSLPVEKSQRRIAEAMKLMTKCQIPGSDVVASLSDPSCPARFSASEVGHEYICSNISQGMFITTATDELGNSLCFREILPLTINLNITSHQYEQYQLLKNAVLSQQRFDTMLHRRPEDSPIVAPRAWWRYAIACVKHEPTSRPWDDVQRIVNCREQYLQLAVKNLLSNTDKGGFHGGLNAGESRVLSQLEHILPVEALLSFHLLALRRVFASRRVQTIDIKAPKRVSRVNTFAKKRNSSTLGRLFSSISGSTNSLKSAQEVSFNEDENICSSPERSDHQLSKQKHSATIRETVVTAQTACHLHICRVKVILFEKLERIPIVTAEFDVCGKSYISGTGKADFTCDIMRFEVFDFVTRDLDTCGLKVLAIEPSNQDVFKCRNDFLVGSIDGSHVPDASPEDNVEDCVGMRLPPFGVACRITALLEQLSLALEISSHPATLVWSKICADRVSDFFMLKTHQIQHQFLQRLRIAATPVAQRAHMAVFYPNSLSIDIAVHAPMVWIPVSPQILDGAIFIDAGKFRMTLMKPEETVDTNWNVDVADIQIMLAGDPSGAAMGEMQDVAADLDGMARLRRKLTTIVHPFEVSVTGTTRGSFQDPLQMDHLQEVVHSHDGIFASTDDEGTGQRISVHVSRIRVNLIDVEVLAKAIGRFYVSGVGMMKKKSAARSDCVTVHSHFSTPQGPEASVFEAIHVCLEKVEAALERYSSKRTYFVEIYSIKLDKRNKGNLTFARLSISDFNIVQLTDVSPGQFGSAVRYLIPSCESQHQVLGRRQMTFDHQVVNSSVTPPASPQFIAPNTPKMTKMLSQSPLRTPTRLRGAVKESPAHISPPPEFISGCHFHDGSKHIDEVELDIVSLVLKVTPTSISDCTMWLTRAIELISLASKEMERRVHERGRNARSEKYEGANNNVNVTNKIESLSSFDLDELPRASNCYISGDSIGTKDSSVIFRVSFIHAAILIGRPASEFTTSRGRRPEDYVVQFKTNASIMTQSIENDNDIGSSTLHVSLEDFSAGINADFQYLDLHVSPILLPTSIDCRLVYDTFKGQTSSQKISFDCERMVWNLAPHSIRVVTSVVRKVMERLQLLRAASETSGSIVTAFVRFRNKGTGILSQIQLELQTLSLTVCQSFKTIGTRPFLKFRASQLKVGLSGCINAMTGEVSACTQLEFFNPKHGFEDIIQSNRLMLSVDQIPNELNLSVSGPEQININVTGALIQEISNLERSYSDLNDKKAHQQCSRFNFSNQTGVAVTVGINTDGLTGQIENISVPPWTSVSLESTLKGIHNGSTLSLGATDRRAITNLPIFPTLPLQRCCLLLQWYPNISSPKKSDKRGFRVDISPVVEFVMQNERIRPGINDVFGVERGQDLLSSAAWSPVSSRHEKNASDRKHSNLFWRPPYLEDDARAWSDSTSVISKKKADCVLPNRNWIWVNEWEVDVDLDLRKNDADGWEYATDFEAFGTTPRSYQPGDLCRRRRWTRTRILNQALNNAGVSSIVWDVTLEEKRSSIAVRSRVQIHNHTSMPLSFFGSCHLWDTDKFIGNAAPGASLCVPLQLALSTHIRLAVPKMSLTPDNQKPTIKNFFSTDQLMILPTSLTSNRIIRASIFCEHSSHGFLSMRNRHFLLTLKCVDGVVDLIIEPALKVINLLPCEMQCQIGEMGSFRQGISKISPTEVFSLGAGSEAKCLSVDCTLCPHLSVRVPGYKWSCWKKIVNRESNSNTWRLTEEEELALFGAFKDSAEHAAEFKTVVHFDHTITGGVSLDIVMSIEIGHSPTVRFYAQYWILDKTSLNLNFTGGFSDFMQSTPEKETVRKSYLTPVEVKDQRLQMDLEREGHEWSLGSCGMILFYSRDEKVSLSVEGETGWSPLIDVSTVMPDIKTTISIDQSHGQGTKRYELAFNITLCPSIFSRSRMITFVPRYRVVNLLEGESLFIAQNGAIRSQMCIPARSYAAFHWHNSSMSPKIRVCSQSGSWSQGCIQLDKIGVTAMRIPSSSIIVVQAEVRLASKKEDSAIVVTIWTSIEKSNPLYLLKNTSQHTILCRQMLDREGAFIWTLNSGESIGFGFDDPEAPHVLEWTWSSMRRFKRTVEVDVMGSMSSISVDSSSVLTSTIQAHQSTKVVLFSDAEINDGQTVNVFEETVDISFRVNLTGISISVINDMSTCGPEREILLLTTEGWHASFSQRQGYHEIELRLTRLQVDNFIFNSEHPVLIYCPSNEDVPFLHLSAVRSLQERSDTLVIRYCALRVLDIDVCLDRKSAETIALFLHPLRRARDEKLDVNWTSSLTSKMRARYSEPSRRLQVQREVNVQGANSGRIYLEELHLHPLRFYLTFTQEGLEWNPVTEGLVIFQLIRGMASIADAPLIFTSFVVSKAFESPSTLIGIILAHYSSQLSSQILSILGSLVILKAPADILSNVGTGVRDFFYEPIQGLVKGPAEFLEGIESGTSSLARGVITGLVRGAASVTDLVSHNLANLTDDEFIDERHAFQRRLVHLVKTDRSQRTIHDALEVAGSFLARGIRSGATGIINQPAMYASRYGTAGLIKGVGKALVGAIVKPVVGVGDAAVVVLTHVSETTTNQVNTVKVVKRMRRALPCTISEFGKSVTLTPYDESSAMAQQIVTQQETEDDVYLGHVDIHLFTVIVSDQFLWIVNRNNDQPRRFRWAEIKGFGSVGNRWTIDFFSSPHFMSFDMSSSDLAAVHELLAMKVDVSSVNKRGYYNLPGIKTSSAFVFGHVNRVLVNIDSEELNGVAEFISKCRSRISRIGSFVPNYFQCLDQEAWLLISFISQAFTGLYSRRCVAVGLINGTGGDVQVLSSSLVQGGSRCYAFPTVEYDKTHGILYPGGAIIFLGWGAAPSLLQPGNVLIRIESNLFDITLGDSMSKSTTTHVLPNWDIDFLEKSYDETEWWAKYWIVVKKKDTSDSH